MIYKHIAIAVDLASPCQILLERGISLAKQNLASLSLVHIDSNELPNYSSLLALKETLTDAELLLKQQAELEAVAASLAWPVTYCFTRKGPLASTFAALVREHQFDLLICGHRHSFWHQFLSSAKKLIQHLCVDILVIPIT